MKNCKHKWQLVEPKNTQAFYDKFLLKCSKCGAKEVLQKDKSKGEKA